jgi:hypothetical protein
METTPSPVPLTVQRRSPGEWKQEILRAYNRVTQELTGGGVSQQRVHLADEYVLVVARHQRVPTLRTIATVDAALARWADVAVVDAVKVRFGQVLTDLGLDVVTVLKDYDPVAELTATVVVLGSPVPCGDPSPGSAPLAAM